MSRTHATSPPHTLKASDRSRQKFSYTSSQFLGRTFAGRGCSPSSSPGLSVTGMDLLMVDSAGDLEGVYGAGPPGCGHPDTDSAAQHSARQPLLVDAGASKHRTLASLLASLHPQTPHTVFASLEPAPIPRDKIDLSFHPHAYKGNGDA